MSLYPSLEDMKVDQLMKAQIPYESQISQQYPTAPISPQHATRNICSLYPMLEDYMGLELNSSVNEEKYSSGQVAVLSESAVVTSSPAKSLSGFVAPLSGQSLGLQRAQVSHGVRQLVLCKDADGKIGLRVKAINSGIFVCLVTANSPAALAGLRFGDQILQINDTLVAGFTMDKVHDLFRKSPVNGIDVVVRDRPFERTVTLHKDSLGHIGFHFKNGKVVGLVQDSSAARNGLLTDHQILEINGQNVIGLKDKELTTIIDGAGKIITLTIIPSYVYEHMIKKMNTSLIKGIMDHSIPSI